MPGAARFTVEVPPPADGSTRARTGRLELTHGVVETPQFMPVGTNATVKALDPDEIAAAGATIILANTYHLYLRPGPRAHRAVRRAAPLHGLGPADPHRLGRVPGRVARRPADRRRGRRDVPQPHRRLDPPLHAGARDRGPGGARLRRRGRLRPAGRAVVAARGRRRRHGPHPPLGRALARGPPARQTRRCSGSSRAAWTRSFGQSRRGSSRASRSTGSASAGWPATRHRSSATRRSTSPSRCWPTIRARATSWGSARRRTCSRPFTGAWTCSIRCCRRGSPGTASCGSRAAG